MADSWLLGNSRLGWTHGASSFIGMSEIRLAASASGKLLEPASVLGPFSWRATPPNVAPLTTGARHECSVPGWHPRSASPSERWANGLALCATVPTPRGRKNEAAHPHENMAKV